MDYLITHTNKCTCIYYLRILKFTFKHLKTAPTYFDHTIIPREHILFLAKIIKLKHSVIYFVTLTFVLWQRVVFVGNGTQSNTTVSLKVYLMAILDNYMFRPLLAIFRLSSRELNLRSYSRTLSSLKTT